ncbi:hypothetical protein NW762_006990 [Fusarium torreyae]|uniref:Uncharacterized protein n=1 Tax=Fusarium torreyae TaxID=1237075 RepID=A0A9W8VE85_9HYPO|nr:hypothetical protein NW762_006990 [Fusarium torreyae]
MSDERQSPLLVRSAKRDRANKHYDFSGAPPEDREDSDYHDGHDSGSGDMDGYPAKRSRRNPIQGEPRVTPCVRCIKNMGDNGPECFCRSQAANNTSACYECARVGRKCEKLPPNAVTIGQSLQLAARRMQDNQTANVTNWSQLVAEAKVAVGDDNTNPHPAARVAIQRPAASAEIPALNVAVPQQSSLEHILLRILEGIETNNRLTQQLIAISRSTDKNVRRLVEMSLANQGENLAPYE